MTASRNNTYGVVHVLVAFTRVVSAGFRVGWGPRGDRRPLQWPPCAGTLILAPHVPRRPRCALRRVLVVDLLPLLAGPSRVHAAAAAGAAVGPPHGALLLPRGSQPLCAGSLSGARLYPWRPSLG
eukprot:CAMPEP_0185189514 /NCGR_PEP_ID=MMETSP1140-20130426/6089_1 /TAXON_ID=298111 /ORGANISM="Pavlova sp., Strain CCMP459" /LENGTH=124 /DNA_ID=CAMNT_0027756081 /DNA_START=136 /DNA_END=508 /DNA_ORIENTATION=-